MEWLSRELAAVAADLHDQPDVEHTVQGVLRHALVLFGGEAAGLMLMQAGHVEAMAGSSPEAEKADLFQVQSGAGPGMVAMSGEDEAVIVDDVSTDPRWPEWTGMAAGLGLHSSLSMPIGTGKARLGVLNLYSARPGAFRDDHARSASLFARHASVALARVQHEFGLHAAVEARSVIGQAQGILMERYGLNADQAFALLRRSARDHDIKLSEHAAKMISTSAHADASG